MTASKRKLPVVAVCGRPNVGKSTLFNRIIGKQRAIVHGAAGITRDRFYGSAEWNGRAFQLVDTGGIVENPIDPVGKKIQGQIQSALDEAKVIVFVVDGQQEITRTDEEVRDALFKLAKPVVLAVNKLDNPGLALNRNEFYVLGLGEPIGISSGHGLGMSQLLTAIVEHLPEPGTAETEDEGRAVTKVAVVGKPNVGKSSFINAILNEDRTIVDEVPGTTRDAIDIEFRWKGKEYLLIDTAGVRKKAAIKKKVEHFSVGRALRAIRRADVCLVMVDATDGLTEQDKRILGYAHENGTAMALVWTKWDLIEDKEARFKALANEISLKAPFINYVPFLTLSNVTRQRLFASFEYVDRIAEEAKKRIGTGELNRLMEKIQGQHKPSGRGGRLAKILYATQVSVKPTMFVLFVNQKRLFHFAYLRYVENQIRAAYSFEGVPIRIELREGKPKE